MNLVMEIQISDDIAIVSSGFAVFERVADVSWGEASGVRYEQVGGLKKFTQYCRSPSLRLARVALKIMRAEAFKCR